MDKRTRTNRDHAFTSSDKFERLYRHEIANLMNDGLEESEIVDVNDVDHFNEDDPRLTDEVCYSFVNAYANCGDPLESVLEVLDEYPDIRYR